MKDYYLLLGVNKKADKSEIKKAYRESAKKFHPDAGGALKDSKQFREITEAYETLSNKETRKEYDERIPKTVSITSSCDAEPLKTGHTQVKRKYNPDPGVHDYLKDFPSGPFRRDVQNERSLKCDIHLTPQETQKDVEFPYTINIVSPCPHCNRYYSRLMFFCSYCNDARYIHKKKELLINIPKGIKNGTQVQLDLDHVGLSDVSLKVKVMISSDREE